MDVHEKVLVEDENDQEEEEEEENEEELEDDNDMEAQISLIEDDEVLEKLDQHLWKEEEKNRA